MAKLAKVGITSKEVAEDVEATGVFKPVRLDKPVTFKRTLSTGSTLLDLAISGTRVRGGGVPPGIMVEIFGVESTGKTAVMAEICACAQSRGGEASVADSESRFDEEYKRIYGVELDVDHYSRPDTVEKLFELYDKFRPEAEGISVFAADSLAALSTEREMESEDKMGMLRAKKFSEGLRKYARRIAQDERLLVCTNQVRDGDHGVKTIGGKAVGFYASLRIQLKRGYPKWRVNRERKLTNGKSVELQVGIISEAIIMKSSIDKPFREAPIYIDFGYGIDDIRANLHWLKDMTKDTSYGLDKATRAQSLDKAIQKIEDNGRAPDLKWAVVDLWEEVQELFEIDRKPKER